MTFHRELRGLKWRCPGGSTYPVWWPRRLGGILAESRARLGDSRHADPGGRLIAYTFGTPQAAWAVRTGSGCSRRRSSASRNGPGSRDVTSPNRPGIRIDPTRRGNRPPMTEPATEPEPVDPGHDPGVDPPPDEETANRDDAVDRAEALDEPERQERLETTIGRDVL